MNPHDPQDHRDTLRDHLEAELHKRIDNHVPRDVTDEWRSYWEDVPIAVELWRRSAV